MEKGWGLTIIGCVKEGLGTHYHWVCGGRAGDSTSLGVWRKGWGLTIIGCLNEGLGTHHHWVCGGRAGDSTSLGV